MTGVTPPPTGGTEMPGSMPAGGQITPLERDNSSLKLALPGGGLLAGGEPSRRFLLGSPGSVRERATAAQAGPVRTLDAPAHPAGSLKGLPGSGRPRVHQGEHAALIVRSDPSSAHRPRWPLLRTPSAIGCLKRLGGTTDAGARAAAEGRSLRYAADLAKIVGDQTERFAILLHSGSL
jgi:hypothetical protein